MFFSPFINHLKKINALCLQISDRKGLPGRKCFHSMGMLGDIYVITEYIEGGDQNVTIRATLP